MAAGLLAASTAWSAPVVDVLIEAARPGALIHEELYGQTLASGGAGQPGALWVGPDSTLPNIRGWRQDLVEALQRLHVPVLRWPAGCQADNYHWRDGVGARAQRPLRRLPDGGAVDDNSVGTHEFFDLAELAGSSAYISANVGTGSAREAAEWAEYLEADGGSTLGQLRVQNGHPQPFEARFVGVGQAPWGCGGNMSAQYYADLYNQFAVFIRGKSTQPPTLVASGNGPAWTAELSKKKRVRDYRFLIGAHDDAQDKDGEGAADGGWMSALRQAARLDTFIASNIAQLDKNDPAHKLPLVISGWNTRTNAAQPQSLRDALAAALQLHVLHAHADRVSMASFSAPLNSPQAMILADGARLTLTPTYHAFRMHAPFQGATALPVRLDHTPNYTVGQLSAPALSVSAARAKDGKLYVSLVNADPAHPQEAAVQFAGASPSKASASVLGADASQAEPMSVPVRIARGQLRITLPAKSLTVVAVDE